MSIDNISLERLREHVEAAKLKHEQASLDASTNAMRMMASYVQPPPQSPLVEGWGDRVDPAEYLRDGVGMSNFGKLDGSQIARPEDRREGDNYPFWRSEAQHRIIVGAARDMATTSEVGLSALENLTNYVVGSGYTYAFDPKPGFENDREVRRWADICQAVSDEFDEANDFAEEGERELFVRSRRDGEFFAGLTFRGGLSVEMRQIDTSFVTEPDNKTGLEDWLKLGPGLDWKYGIAAEPNNPTRVHGYFVQWNGDNNDWDFFHPRQMVHLKLNVDREVKRGMSDFFPVQGNLVRGDKLLGNTLEGAAVQAAIAFIREHAAGTSTDVISNMVVGGADRQVTQQTGLGSKTRNIKKYPPGSVHDVTNGMKYHAGPLGGTNGPRFIEVVQAALRMVGIRWTMPEYMISGDASNGNFASTLVAESPFTKSSEAKQAMYIRKYREMKWKAVGLVAMRTGRFGTSDLRRIKSRVECTVDAPEIAVRNRLEDHQIRQQEHEAGILSLETWAAEADRNLEDEVAKGARPQPKTPQIPNISEHWRGYP